MPVSWNLAHGIFFWSLPTIGDKQYQAALFFFFLTNSEWAWAAFHMLKIYLYFLLIAHSFSWPIFPLSCQLAYLFVRGLRILTKSVISVGNFVLNLSFIFSSFMMCFSMKTFLLIVLSNLSIFPVDVRISLSNLKKPYKLSVSFLGLHNISKLINGELSSV